MPISGRLVVQSAAALLTIGFLALLGIVGLTVWLGERAQFYSSQTASDRDIRTSAAELRSGLQSAEASQRGYLASGNEIYLAPYDAAKIESERQLQRLTRLVGDERLSPMMSRLSAVVAAKIDEMNRTIALKRELREAEVAALFRTNRGKALMDEANVFLSSIIRAADERLTTGVAEQQSNALMLRWVSILGAIVIILVVAVVALTVGRYAKEIAQARDDVRNMNASLEIRVKERTNDLERARARAETLLAEVNHRVANSLTLVSSLIRLQRNAVKDPSAKAALDETEARIYAVSMVHKRLYASGEAGWVALDEYLTSLLEHMEVSMRDEGKGPFLRYELEPMNLKTDASINLGVIVSEWVTNAVKYAYPGARGEVRVSLKSVAGGKGELSVEDDGVGLREENAPKGTGLGSRVVAAMADSFGAKIEYYSRRPGLGARLTFPVMPAVSG